ncbi:sarcosine oxidase subunit gamma [Phenylobacterium sp.]|jgi:sarcosine oxidase subunit gamma|uniref:sarcosine oxidase subunit gamma n=1 Tax=Phenylobacterium sp. TaxID=1871053 RepID=UPI0037C6F870
MLEPQIPAWRFEGDVVRISETRPPVVVLRTLSVDADLIARLGTAAGFEWPATPNTARLGVHWTGPSEWTLVGDAAVHTRAICGAALDNVFHHLADVGPGRRQWEITGPGAADLMARGCGLDLHPRSFGAEACAQTLFADTPALLARASDGAFRIFAGADVAGHLRAWFQAAGQRG